MSLSVNWGLVVVFCVAFAGVTAATIVLHWPSEVLLGFVPLGLALPVTGVRGSVGPLPRVEPANDNAKE